MSLSQLTVTEYDALRGAIDAWKAKGTDGRRLVLLFLSDHVDGKGWCPDCVAAEPIVDETLKDGAVASASDVTFIRTFVGLRDAWKDQTNSFRTSPDLLVNSIPTLLEYGKLDRRLGDKECTSVETIKAFILGK